VQLQDVPVAAALDPELRRVRARHPLHLRGQPPEIHDPSLPGPRRRQSHRHRATATGTVRRMTTGVGEPGLGEAPGRSVSYLRVYTDMDGITRFEDLDHPTVPVDFAPPAPQVFATAPVAADSTLFLAFPQGWTSPAHPSPARQLALFLSGDAIGTAGDEERRVGPGSIVLMEDTTGPGHGLTALTDIIMAIVRLGPPE
jgi:hypothetical protein